MVPFHFHEVCTTWLQGLLCGGGTSSGDLLKGKPRSTGEGGGFNLPISVFRGGRFLLACFWKKFV